MARMGARLRYLPQRFGLVRPRAPHRLVAKVLVLALAGLLVGTACAEDEEPTARQPVSVSVEATPDQEPLTYTVRSGDTLADVASRFGVSASLLASTNDVADPNVIEAGDKLVIPGILVPAPVLPTPRGPNPFVYDDNKESFDWLPFRAELTDLRDRIDSTDATLVVGIFAGALLLPFALQIIVWLVMLLSFGLRQGARLVRLPVSRSETPESPTMGGLRRSYFAPVRWLTAAIRALRRLPRVMRRSSWEPIEDMAVSPAADSNRQPAPSATESLAEGVASGHGHGMRGRATGLATAVAAVLRAAGAGLRWLVVRLGPVALATGVAIRRAGSALFAGLYLGIARLTGAAERHTPAPAVAGASGPPSSVQPTPLTLPPATLRGSGGDQLRDRMQAWELRRAFEAGELTMDARPLVLAADRVPAGSIAMLSWPGEGGQQAWAERLPTSMKGAGGTLALSLLRFLLERAVATLKVGDERLPVRVPFTVDQVIEPEFATSLRALVGDDKETAALLELELLEAELVGPDVTVALAEVVTAVDTLRDVGVQITLGDFDARLSAAELGRLGVTTVAIDFGGAAASEERQARISDVIVGAQSLHLTVLASGLTSEEETGLAWSLGCRFLSGPVIA